MTKQSFGSWPSPVTAQMLTGVSPYHFSQLQFDGSNLYWVEEMPNEGGRNAVVCFDCYGQTAPITESPYNVRTRAHEYGGRSYVVHEDTVYFSNFADQRLYRQKRGEDPIPVTAPGPLRYADMVFDARHRRIIAVREDHRVSDIHAETTLVIIDPQGDEYGTPWVSGHDFYMHPHISEDGSRCAYLAWNHPQMPWDGTELWLADISSEGELINRRHITGSAADAILQPTFSPGGVLTFLSDRSGWWNLYQWVNDDAQAVFPAPYEFGMPPWVFGMTSYGYLNEDRILAVYTDGGIRHLVQIDVKSHSLTEWHLPYTYFDSPAVRDSGHAAFIGASWHSPVAIVNLCVARGTSEVIRPSQVAPMDTRDISVPVFQPFPAAESQQAFMAFYPPNNHRFTGPDHELPPLIVISHGGPTSTGTPLFSPAIQYWTTRGFAVADVDYGGSSGHGRAYRNRLRGQWGIVDVDDCTRAALYLADQGAVDPRRMVIRGGSAGGFTTLACLTFRDVFRAGASYYGVSDLAALARETHKFESRYLDSLIGPWPEREEIYRERSPLFHAERIHAPVIFFQGLDDKVVLPEQSQMMVEELRHNHVPVSYIAFPDEGHGFRNADNIERAIQAEWYFYSRILGFPLPEPIEPVAIDNLP